VKRKAIGCCAQRGAALMEAAVVLPVLVLLLCGMIQYGFLFAAHITLRNAASFGARAAVLEGATDDAVVQTARDAVAPFLDSGQLAVTIERPSITGSPATRVQLSYPYAVFAPFAVPGSVDGNFALTASATLR